MIKRTLFTFIFLLAFSVCPIKAAKISAASAVLYDPLSGAVLYEKDAGVRRGMASTTKIMTALVALEQYDTEQVVEIQPEWCGIEGSSMYLQAGERLTVSDLLYGLLLTSGNDAATALAGMHPDGPDAFVAQMNKTAADLSLKDTHFDNPSGLDGATHYMTALDLAKLTAKAMENGIFAEIVSTQSASVAERTLKNHNRLLADIGACGVKTGYTKACGRCLVSAKEQNGRMLICVTLNAPNDWQDHAALYDYGFSQYRLYDVLGAGDCGSVPLVSSTKTNSLLYCSESAALWLTEAEAAQITTELCGPRFWYGATTAGAPYGSVQIKLGREVLWKSPVYFSDHSEEVQPEITGWKRLLNTIFRSREH